MLKAQINAEKGIVEVKRGGNLPELMSDITTLLGCIYDGLSEINKDAFKFCISMLVKDELYSKTCEEVHEIVKEKEEKEEVSKFKEEAKEKLEKVLKGLLKDLLK